MTALSIVLTAKPMLKAILGIVIREIIEAVTKAVSDYFALQKKKKEDEQAVKDAVKIKDPTARARAIRNILQ